MRAPCRPPWRRRALLPSVSDLDVEPAADQPPEPRRAETSDRPRPDPAQSVQSQLGSIITGAGERVAVGQQSRTRPSDGVGSPAGSGSMEKCRSLVAPVNTPPQEQRREHKPAGGQGFGRIECSRKDCPFAAGEICGGGVSLATADGVSLAAVTGLITHHAGYVGLSWRHVTRPCVAVLSRDMVVCHVTSARRRRVGSQSDRGTEKI